MGAGPFARWCGGAKMVPMTYIKLISSVTGGCGLMASAHAALLQTVDFSVQDQGYTLSGDGGSGTYAVGGAGGLVAVGAAPLTFSAQPTGFSGNYFATERPNNVNGTAYSYVAGGDSGKPAAAVYLTLPQANGTLANGSVTFSFTYAAPNASADRYDGVGSDSPWSQTVMEYRVDGGAWQTALALQGRGIAGGNSFGMWWDDNFDGVFDDSDTQVTGTAAPVARTITGMTITSSFQARIRLVSSTQEEMALDDISVSSPGFIAIPEPATYGWMGAGACGIALGSGRRRRSGRA